MCFTLGGRRVGSASVNLGRLLMAWVLLVLLHLALYGSVFPCQAGGPRLGWLGLSGLIGFALGDAVLFEAFLLIGPRLAMLLMTLSPLFSAILAWLFLHQALSLARIGAMAVTLLGIAWVVGGDGDSGTHPHLGRGILLGMGGALGQSVGLLCSKFGLAGDYSPVSANLIRASGGVLALLLYFGFTRTLGSTLAALKDGRATSFIALGAVTGPHAGRGPFPGRHRQGPHGRGRHPDVPLPRPPVARGSCRLQGAGGWSCNPRDAAGPGGRGSPVFCIG